MSNTAIIYTCCHASPKVDNKRFEWLGNLIYDIKPDYVFDLGDFADMSSLNSYDTRYPKAIVTENYEDDIEVVRDAQEKLREKFVRRKTRKPIWIGFEGNHEHRIERVIENDPKLDGTISTDQLPYQDWKVYPYQQVEIIDGIAYTHVFTTGVMGRPVTSARALVTKKHMSCVQGHNQKMEIYNEYKADGTLITGLFAGCCYMHDEDYLGPQGNNYFRGIHMLYDVKEGGFHCHSITLDYLLKRNAKRKRDNGAMV